MSTLVSGLVLAQARVAGGSGSTERDPLRPATGSGRTGCDPLWPAKSADHSFSAEL